MEKLLSREMADYVESCKDELVDLIKTLCAIPAPSNDEMLRAEFCRQWFMDIGAEGVHIDDALNCVVPVGDVTKDVIIFMAHTDTVFPDLEPFTPVEKDGRLYCPGVGDDTANLALLMIVARYFIKNNIAPKSGGILFVCDSGEEGLGNLKGCRKIMEDYGDKTRLVVSFDGGIGYVCNGAVGSHRYKVTVKAKGGHSFGSFGNTNAIHLLSLLIADLYTIDPPKYGNSKTTFNVGLIEGGTSVNSIAQTATMLYEYRSDDKRCIDFMEKTFWEKIEHHKSAAEGLEVEVLGMRPCMGDVDEAAQKEAEKIIFDITRRATGKDAKTGSGSTDLNLPYSMGIPGYTTGGYMGEGAHTREEYIDLSTLPMGLQIIMALVGQYFS